MQALFIILIVLIALALVFLTVTIPYATVILHFKDKKLSIHIKHWIYKKKFEIDFNKNKIKEETLPKEMSPDKEKKVDFKEKLKKAKDRIFSKEDGLNTEELKAVWEEFTQDYNDIYNIFKTFLGRFRHKAEIPLIKINLDYGTDNPATTGMIYGWIWSLIGILYPLATRYFHIAYPQVDITPDFYGERFDAEVKSIIKVRATHIINAAIPALWSPAITYLKNKKHKGRGKNGR